MPDNTVVMYGCYPSDWKPDPGKLDDLRYFQSFPLDQWSIDRLNKLEQKVDSLEKKINKLLRTKTPAKKK